ncbi:MAG: CHAP domain-containing protein, partial [Atopobiaceae bacterium]|nr:CHAP domain-containing protein [Atopobiaceae bacterium]
MARSRHAGKDIPQGSRYRDVSGDKQREAIDAVSSSSLASRIEENGAASHDMQARLEEATSSVGSAARTSRIKQQSAKAHADRPRAPRGRRGRQVRSTSLALEISDQMREDARKDARKREEQESEIDLVDEGVDEVVVRRIENAEEDLRRPFVSAGKVLGRRAKEAGEEALRDGVTRLRAARLGINSGDKSDGDVHDGTKEKRKKRGIAERALESEESKESRAKRIHRVEAATTRSVGSSAAAAIAAGDDSALPLSLADLARKSAAKVAAAVGNTIVGATGAAVSAIAAALPALAPILVVAALVGTILYSIVSIAAIQASHSIGGGQAIAAIAEQEYATGVARGDYNKGGVKDRQWFGVDGDWCAMFVCWCADQCGFIEQGIVPRQGFAGFDSYSGPKGSGENPGYTIYGAANYTPQPGDIFIYGGNAPENISRGAGYGDHVALVTIVLEDGSFYTVEGNTSGPGSGDNWSTRVVNKKLHEKVDGGWTGTTWAGDFCVVRPAYPVSQGQVIEIPEPYGNGGFTVTEYDLWFEDWAGGTNQRTVADEWDSKGRKWRDDIAAIDGRYLVACTTTYGTVGDRLTFYLSDGTAIPCVMADAKSMNDPGCN